jgi:hypothetical protein
MACSRQGNAYCESISEADKLLEGLGAKPIAYDPMLDYWLRMATGALALVGGWYLVLTIWPRKFCAAIPWFGALTLIEGLILLVHGLRLSLPPFPLYGDVSACFVAGSGILLCFDHEMLVKSPVGPDVR